MREIKEKHRTAYIAILIAEEKATMLRFESGFIEVTTDRANWPGASDL
jgi:hypothetical protein